LELRHLRTFRSIARNSSFTRAAAELGYVQSAVTAHIKSLEAELGVRLFDRLGRRVILTDAGRRLLGRAERLLDLAEETRAAVAGDGRPAGTVTVSATEMHCAYRLPPVLKEMRVCFPEVRLVFRPSPIGVLDATLRREIREGAVDVAFVLQRPPRPDARSEDFVVEPLIEEPLLLVAPPHHPLVRAVVVGPGDLEDEPVLLAERGCGYRAVFEDVMARAGVRLNATIEFSSGEASKRCVEAGMGVAVLAAVSVAEEIQARKLAALRWEEQDFSVMTQMVLHKDKWISPALGAFLDVARRVLGAQDIKSSA
jgi:DNA-binding transcriptional LysR family regulator